MTLRHHAYNFPLALVVLASHARAQGNNNPALSARVDSIATAVLASTGVPSATVAVVVHGQVAYAQAYGSAKLEPQLAATPVDMPIEVLLGKTPRMTRDVQSARKSHAELSTAGSTIGESLDRLLCLPAIADKSFLITIGDRSVGGMISRDQMVGPWQVPVADAAVSLNSYDGYGGEAMAMGERSPVAVLNAPASGRLAVAEAITNILAADIRSLTDIRLSANWMAACGEPGEDADLYATVRAVGADVVGAACIIELAFLGGRSRIDTMFESVVCYES